MIRTIHLYVLLLLMTATNSCSGSKKATTEIMSSWSKPGVAAQSFHRIFISALTSDRTAKQTIENGIQTQLAPRLTVIKSTDVFSPGFELANKAHPVNLLEKIKTTNADAILTVTLLDKRDETFYTPSSVHYNPLQRYRYFGQFTTYYGARGSVIYEPGYYTKDTVYFLETNLYDTKTGDLIWSAQSAAYNLSNLDTFLTSYLKEVVKTLKRDGLISGQ